MNLHIVLEGHHPKEQQRGLHKGRQADGNYLFAPLVESICVPSRHTKQVQASYSRLYQEDATPLDVGKEHLDHAVGKGQQKEYELQTDLYRSVGIKGKAQDLPGEGSYGAALFPRKNPRQVSGEDSL